MKKLMLGFFAATILSTAAVAAPTPPDQVIKATTDKLQTLITQNHVKYAADKPAFYKVVEDVVVPSFDTKYIGQLVLGRNWKTATPDQRTRFEKSFKSMLINSYADSLLEYHDSVKAEIKPPKMAADAKEAVVNTNILRKDAPPIALNFSTRLVGDEWKIYDITVENISLITNFRTQINAEIKKSSLDAVIGKLEGGTNLIAPGTADVKASGG